MSLDRLRQINLGLTLIGVLIFSSLWAYIQFAPDDFDKRTREFAISQVEDELNEGLAQVATSDTAQRISDIAGQVSEGLQSRIDSIRSSLDQGLDVFIADILAAACKLDCERQEQARQSVQSFFESQIARYGFAIDRIEDLVIGEYDEVMSELRFDLAIFCGSNAVVLAFAFFLSLLRGSAARHILPFAIALSGMTIAMGSWYIFGQDWVTTVIYNDYWGWAYSIVLAVLSVFLLDIAANRAKVTSSVLNIFSPGFYFSSW